MSFLTVWKFHAAAYDTLVRFVRQGLRVLLGVIEPLGGGTPRAAVPEARPNAP